MVTRLGWDPTKGVPWLQPGGPGYPFKQTTGSTSVTGAQGGGQSSESRYARSERGGAGQYDLVGTVQTGNPEPYNFDVMFRVEECNWLDKYDCPYNILVLQGCGRRESLIDYTLALLYVGARKTGRSYGANLVNGTDNNAEDVMDTISFQAGEEIRLKKLSHLNISGTVSDFAINKVYYADSRKCADSCGAEQSGEDVWWAVTDKDNTPGYLSTATPLFLFTRDGGTTWSSSYINAMLNGDATDVVRYGDYVIVAGPSNGIAYAKYADLVNGVTGAWRSAAGLSSSGFPRALAVVNGEVWAAGNNGYIYKSSDGINYTVVSAGTVTTAQLNQIAVAGCGTLYFAGNSGALVKYDNGVLSLLPIVVSGTTISSNLNTVAVPFLRGYEVFVGTAAGRIYGSRDEGQTWTERSIDGSGTGSINDLKFADTYGAILYIVQTNAAGKSRVLRDLTGGAGGLLQVEIVGSYDSPANSGMNSIAPANANIAVTAGELNGTYAFIGKVG
ncbi:MAG: hypothetical protein E6Q97_25095 [Desulfurellales bacterium]|nr:MAG: hypothetical protein E6Q97_25095 [Desulfurellales bacterium]